VHPLVVLSKVFPARPSSIPDIHDFVRQRLADSPLSAEENRELQRAVAEALLDAASPEGGFIQVSFRIFPGNVEIDVLHGKAAGTQVPGTVGQPEPPRQPAEQPAGPSEQQPSFAAWMTQVLRRELLSQEEAARQLGVSVKTVRRWVGGETEPRLRDLRRIREIFGDVPGT
jgi:hypothetical protein